ncbi:hypothetical protein ACTVZO_16260 [Streptomyces sp. IBSNAI002]|uniref:hypothetical protein n=1 Tax=Streptomyces sp. IBSNAI002 TaxID=3457500 RepID=UPI003FCF33CD
MVALSWDMLTDEERYRWIMHKQRADRDIYDEIEKCVEGVKGWEGVLNLPAVPYRCVKGLVLIGFAYCKKDPVRAVAMQGWRNYGVDLLGKYHCSEFSDDARWPLAGHGSIDPRAEIEAAVKYRS